MKGNAFKKVLIDLANLSMQEQKIKLEKAFNDWKGSEEQVDDVCVMGVKIQNEKLKVKNVK